MYYIPDNTQWHQATWRLDDECLVGTWVFNFRFNAGNYYVQRVTVGKVERYERRVAETHQPHKTVPITPTNLRLRLTYLNLRWHVLDMAISQEGMHVITRLRLREFAKKHPQCDSPLTTWYRLVTRTTFTSVAHLRQTFPHADPVSKYLVFNIGVNDFRLVTVIHFDRLKIYISAVMTHAQYDKIDLNKGSL